jgi:hypothetical protein
MLLVERILVERILLRTQTPNRRFTTLPQQRGRLDLAVFTTNSFNATKTTAIHLRKYINTQIPLALVE